MPIKIYVETTELYPAYTVRDVGGPPINKISEVILSVHKPVFDRWYRTLIEYEMVQEEIAKKLKEQQTK